MTTETEAGQIPSLSKDYGWVLQQVTTGEGIEPKSCVALVVMRVISATWVILN